MLPLAEATLAGYTLDETIVPQTTGGLEFPNHCHC